MDSTIRKLIKKTHGINHYGVSERNRAIKSSLQLLYL